jgi:hypothetical protein
MSRVAAVVMLVGLGAGCGFRELGRGDGGGGGCGPAGELVSCAQSVARAYMPLGSASIDSTRAGAIATTGGGALVTWERAGARATDPSTAYVAVVDRLGKVSGARKAADGASPVLVRGAGGAIELWYRGGADMRRLVRVGLDESGAQVGDPVEIYDSTDEGFAVVWTGEAYAVVISGAGDDPYQIYSLLVGADGSLRAGPTLVPEVGPSSLQPALAWDGCGTLVATWTDARAGTPRVYAARFDRAFGRLGPDLLLSDPATRGSFSSVAHQESGGFVVCHQQLVTSDNQEIVCHRLDEAGAETATVQLSDTLYPSQNPHVVTHGRRTWVLWDDHPNGSQTPSVVYQFLDEAGQPVLDRPKDSGAEIGSPGAWRPFGAVTGDALLFVQYQGGTTGRTWTAEVVMENCY